MLAQLILNSMERGVDLTPTTKSGGRQAIHGRTETYDEQLARKRRQDLSGGFSEHSFNYSGISL